MKNLLCQLGYLFTKRTSGIHEKALITNLVLRHLCKFIHYNDYHYCFAKGRLSLNGEHSLLCTCNKEEKSHHPSRPLDFPAKNRAKNAGVSTAREGQKNFIAFTVFHFFLSGNHEHTTKKEEKKNTKQFV